MEEAMQDAECVASLRRSPQDRSVLYNTSARPSANPPRTPSTPIMTHLPSFGQPCTHSMLPGRCPRGCAQVWISASTRPSSRAPPSAAAPSTPSTPFSASIPRHRTRRDARRRRESARPDIERHPFDREAGSHRNILRPAAIAPSRTEPRFRPRSLLGTASDCDRRVRCVARRLLPFCCSVPSLLFAHPLPSSPSRDRRLSRALLPDASLRTFNHERASKG